MTLLIYVYPDNSTSCEQTELSFDELSETAIARSHSKGSIMILAVDPYSERAVVVFNAYRNTVAEAIKAKLMLRGESRMTVAEPKLKMIKNNAMEVENEND